MLDPRKWSRRTFVLLALVASMALPVVLSACSSSDSDCPEGEILSNGECINPNG